MSKTCTLDSGINDCPFFRKENNNCTNKRKCSFQKSDTAQTEYKREERWYEKYYK